jgi:serine/threonine protein phosphatase 1
VSILPLVNDGSIEKISCYFPILHSIPMRQFAISDIHGHLASFKALLDRLELTKEDELFLLGDFIDRGPDSKGVIDHVQELQAAGYQVHCLRGNHEQMAIDAPTDLNTRAAWLRYGGEETCESFGTDDYTVPDDYLNWMTTLPFYLQTKGYLFVHAGINTHKTHPLTDFTSMLWARNWSDKIDREWLGDTIIVHGHTPTPHQDIQLSLHTLAYVPVINIDAGCFATHRPGMGYLCALELGSHALTFQETVD